MRTLLKYFKFVCVFVTVVLGAWIGVAMFSSCFVEGEVEAESLLSGDHARATKARQEEARQRSQHVAEDLRAANERISKALARDDARDARLQQELEAAEKAPRQVRRWTWMSPTDTREQLWNVPENEAQEALLTGLLRICMAEAEGSEEDCIGIWQVLRNIRQRTCNREVIERITECEGDEETMLSAMRRAQRFVLGMLPSKNTRQQWISKLTTSCDPPDNYPSSQDVWEKQERHHCVNTTALAEQLIAGEGRQSITSASIITWGGRCEDPQGACDDTMACTRGLARVDTPTKNAFWCRPGSSGCAKDLDPICKQYLRIPETPPPEPLALEKVAADRSGESS
jgi:hypothetical protein